MLSINTQSPLMNAEQWLYDTLPSGAAINEAASSVSAASQGQGISPSISWGKQQI